MSTPEKVSEEAGHGDPRRPTCEDTGAAQNPGSARGAEPVTPRDGAGTGLTPAREPADGVPSSAPSMEADRSVPPLPGTCPPDVAVFLRQVFALGDCLVIRPIEIWNEPDGKRSSRTTYKRMIYPRIGTPKPRTWSGLLKTAEEENANLFFGVCPRVGGKGRFDLAWQIRVVRVLWADLDFCSADEALARYQTHGVPSPSAVVRSCNGVHLY
jgi:hypothetical protein